MKKQIRFFKFIILSFIILNSCAKDSSNPMVVNQKYKMTVLKTDISTFEPLIWEKQNSKNKDWSKMIYSVIENEETSYFKSDIADDVENFCPQYKKLTSPQRLNFWGQLFAAISQPESSWVPITRTMEPEQGVDPVTNKLTFSEGLLQLSYKDEKSYKIDCGFNWNRDRLFPETDIRRSILDPYLNLRCGVKIMAIQLKKYKKIQVDFEYLYWSVLFENGSTNKKDNTVAYIKNATQSLSFCK